MDSVVEIYFSKNDMHVSDKGSSVAAIISVVRCWSSLWFYLMPIEGTYKLATSEIWAWKQKMCNTTRDLSLQMYALFACRFLPHPIYPNISWCLTPTFGPLQKCSFLCYVLNVFVLCVECPVFSGFSDLSILDCRFGFLFSLVFICPSGLLIFPITFFLYKCRCFSRYSFTVLINSF